MPCALRFVSSSLSPFPFLVCGSVVCGWRLLRQLMHAGYLSVYVTIDLDLEFQFLLQVFWSKTEIPVSGGLISGVDVWMPPPT